MTALVRLFPRFKEADSTAWETVIKRAREGADHPFQPTGHTDATEKHPVCQQVSTTIGAGKSRRGDSQGAAGVALSAGRRTRSTPR